MSGQTIGVLLDELAEQTSASEKLYRCCQENHDVGQARFYEGRRDAFREVMVKLAILLVDSTTPAQCLGLLPDTEKSNH